MKTIVNGRRVALLVGNWKMALPKVLPNKSSFKDASELANNIALGLPKGVSRDGIVRVGVAPSSLEFGNVHYAFIRPKSDEMLVAVGGQSFYADRKDGEFVLNGAFTGEDSLLQLLNAGAHFSILGHSETRASTGPDYGVEGLGLTDEMLNTRLLAALSVVMKESDFEDFFMIFCVGETLKARQNKQTKEVLDAQLSIGLKDVPARAFEKGNVVIAYEPVWAIGTGETASAEEANASALFIRSLISAEFGSKAAERLIIQYGGSAKPENTPELMSQPDIDGLLIGGAALKADSFLQMITLTQGLGKY